MASPNGPAGMYKLKQYFDVSTSVELPKCMYTLKSYHDGVHIRVEGTQISDETRVETTHCKNDQVQCDFKDPLISHLEKRQDAILDRLAKLSKEVEELSKNVPKPRPVTSNVIASATAQPTTVPSNSAAFHQKTESVTATLSPDDHKTQNGLLRDVVISADASSPPLSVIILHSLLSNQYRVMTSCHVHSSVSNVPQHVKSLFGNKGVATDRNSYDLGLTIIWKDAKHGPSLMVSPSAQTMIVGEACIARYLARLLKPCYEEDIVKATEIDAFIDMASHFNSSRAKEKAGILRTLNSKLGISEWLIGSVMSIADIVMWSVIQQAKQADTVPGNVKKWIQTCNNHVAFKQALDLAQS